MIAFLVSFLSSWLVPLLVAAVIIFGLVRKVNVFEAFVEGAKEGFSIAVRLIPYLVGMLVAIGLFRDSGAMELLVEYLSPLMAGLHIPSEVLPLAIMRPISGNGSLALLTEIMQSSGPDSFPGRLASTMMGSTATTFYILTIYFGSVGISKTRHSLPVGLLADLGGFLVSVVVCRLAFG